MAKHVNSMKQNYFANWHELDDKSKVDLEDAWLQKEMKGEEPNSSVRLQLHKEFMREALGLTEVNDYPKSYNDVLKAWLIDQGESGKSLPSLLKKYWEDAEALAFQTLGPRLDGAISTEVQRGTGAPTFTRNTVGNVRNWENVYRAAPAGEARIQGARRVENLLTYSEDLDVPLVWGSVGGTVSSATRWTGTSGDYILQRTDSSGTFSGNSFNHTWTLSFKVKGNVSFDAELRQAAGASNKHASLIITTDMINEDEYTRISISGSATVDNAATGVGVLFSLNGTGYLDITEIQLEEVSGQTDTAPGPYVSRDDPTGDNILSNANSQFKSGHGWVINAGWNVVGEKAVATGTSSLIRLTITSDIEVGKIYEIGFDLLSISGDSISMRIGTQNIGQVTTAGSHRGIVTADNQFIDILPWTGSGLNAVVDNIQLREVTTGVKYFYDSEQNEVADNNILQSRDFDTTWATSGAAPILTQNEVGYDGEADKAWTLEDDSPSTAGITQTRNVLPSDDVYEVSYFVKKEPNRTQTTYPELFIGNSGGTTRRTIIGFDPESGDHFITANEGGDVPIVYDYSSTYWKVVLPLTCAGDQSGVFIRAYPSRYAVWGGSQNNAATGTMVLDQVQLSLGSGSHTETQVETTTAAIANIVGQKTKVFEQVDNQLLQSDDLDTTWTKVAGVTLDETETVNGVVEHTITDGGAAYRYFEQNVNVDVDTNYHAVSCLFKKDNDEARFPSLAITDVTGTTVYSLGFVNTKTGAVTNTINGSANHYIYSENKGRYWKVTNVWQNDGTESSVNVRIYPSVSTIFGGSGQTSATGSCTIAQVQLSLNRYLSYPSYIPTNVSAITLGKDTGRSANLQLHPTKYELGAKLFETFDQWTASTAYSVGDRIIPLTGSGTAGGNGYYYKCVVAGTSDSSEPTFGTTVGDGTYDNGVVWECMGYATVAGYLAEAQRTNNALGSRDFNNATFWTKIQAPTATANMPGIAGDTDAAYTIADNDAVQYSTLDQSITIPATQIYYTFSLYFLKDSDETRFPGVVIKNVANTERCSIFLNTATGDTRDNNAGSANHDYWSEDHGDWWRLCIRWYNNGSDTQVDMRLYPAISDVWSGGGSNTATGSCVIDWAQMEDDTQLPSMPIATTSSAVTRSASVLSYAEQTLNDSEGSATVTPFYPSSVGSGIDTGIIARSDAANPTLMYLNTNGTLYSYDGTATKSVSGTLPSDQSFNLGIRWGNSLQQLYRVGVANTEGSYDDSWSTDGLAIGHRNGGNVGLGCFKNIVIYNKDLGDTKLESSTSYD